MDEIQIRTLEGIEQFLSEPAGSQLKLQGSKDYGCNAGCFIHIFLQF